MPNLTRSLRKKPLILVADDDPRIRMIFKMKVAEAGYEVEEAEDGDVAWKKIEEMSPSAVIIDMKMPGLHGLEVIARITRSGNMMPVLVCSAYDQLKDELVIANYPMLEYFVKPVNPAKLLEALKSFVPIDPQA